MLSSLLSKNLSQKSQEHKEDPINLLDQVNLPSNNIDNILGNQLNRLSSHFNFESPFIDIAKEIQFELSKA